MTSRIFFLIPLLGFAVLNIWGCSDESKATLGDSQGSDIAQDLADIQSSDLGQDQTEDTPLELEGDGDTASEKDGHDGEDGEPVDIADLFSCDQCSSPMICNEAADACVFDCASCEETEVCNEAGDGCVSLPSCQDGVVALACLCGGVAVDQGHCCESQATQIPCLPAPAYPFQHHFGSCWRGSHDINMRAAKALGYQYIIDSPTAGWFHFKDHPLATDMRFFVESPENGNASMPLLPTIAQEKLDDFANQSFSRLFNAYPHIASAVSDADLDALRDYDNEVWLAYKAVVEAHFCWADASQEFPRNMAQSWNFSNGTYRFMWDYQQQAVIDYLVDFIRRDLRERENPANNFLYAGLAWDVERRWFEFDGRLIPYDDETYPRPGADPNASALVHEGISHEYPTFREGVMRFYLAVRSGMEEEFGDTRENLIIFEPWSIWGGGGWTADWGGYYRAVLEAPYLTEEERALIVGDYLTAEGPGLNHFLPASEGGDLDDLLAAGYLSSKSLGSSTQDTYDVYYDPNEESNLVYMGVIASTGSWFNNFGAFNRSGDDITDWPDALVLTRMLANWENIHQVPLADRHWDSSAVVYSSPMAYADQQLIYGREPRSGALFVVFMSESASLTLAPGEEVAEIRVANELYEAHGEGSLDAMAHVEVDGTSLSLAPGLGQVGELYVVILRE